MWQIERQITGDGEQSDQEASEMLLLRCHSSMWNVEMLSNITRINHLVVRGVKSPTITL